VVATLGRIPWGLLVSVGEFGLVGRQAELLAVDALLDVGGGSGALFVEGEAGIGKSTVWGHGVAAAMRAGWRVLTSRGSQTETGYSFAGLTDLFDLVLAEVGRDLRPPQREALEVALLRGPPGAAPLGEREVGAASLALLRRLAEDGPVLLALDDVQWIDHATIDAIAFALRRLPTEPIRLLAARRITGAAVMVGAAADRSTVLGAAFAAERVGVLRLGALDGAAIGRLVETRLGVQLAGRDLTQLVERTNGNPFWALEIGSAITRHGMPDGQLPVPESLSALVAGRLAELTPEVREALLVCSALSAPSIEQASTALVDVADNPARVLDAAMTAGVVQLAVGQLHPAHPLLGSIALDGLPPGARQRLYRRLAAIVSDPEQHARLLVLGAGGEPDADVATALDAGAAAAHSRGAINAAAKLAEHAAAMTPRVRAEDRARRLIVAGELLFARGDVPNAHQTAEQALAESPTSSLRCRAGLLLTSIEYWADGATGWMEHTEQALRDAGDDIELQARAHALIADLAPDGATNAEFHAQRALELLAERGAAADQRTVAHATLTLQMAQLALGGGLDEDLLRRAGAAEARAPRPPMVDRTENYRGCWLKNVDELDGALAAVHMLMDVANAEGDETALSNLVMNVALIQLWSGDYPAGIEAAEEAIRIGEDINILADTAYFVRGQLAAYTGDFDWVHKHLPARLTLAKQGNVRGAGYCLAAIGAAQLLDGDAVSAAGTLRQAYDTLLALDIREPSCRLRLESDFGQALITIGELDEAAALVTELRTFGPRSSAPTTRGIALRIEGMVEGARGDLDRATELLEEADRVHEQSPIPLERGRTLLALGQLFRRRRAKGHAGTTLQAALDCFTALGATPFIALAEAELARTGGAPKDATLTTAEQRVADLVASGLSNKDIAARLFVSVRTIDSQLTAVYRKLGVRSRIELTRQLTRPRNAGKTIG